MQFPNALLANMLLEQFSQQSTLNGVAQAVVDKVVRIHHDAYMRDSERQRCQKREDITLMVRNFNCFLPNAHSCGIPCGPTNQEKLIENNTLSDIISIPGSFAEDFVPGPADSIFMNDQSISGSSDSFGGKVLFKSSKNNAKDLSLDEEGKVKPYVDFSDVYAAIDEAIKDGLIIEE